MAPMPTGRTPRVKHRTQRRQAPRRAGLSVKPGLSVLALAVATAAAPALSQSGGNVITDVATPTSLTTPVGEGDTGFGVDIGDSGGDNDPGTFGVGDRGSGNRGIRNTGSDNFGFGGGLGFGIGAGAGVGGRGLVDGNRGRGGPFGRGGN